MARRADMAVDEAFDMDRMFAAFAIGSENRDVPLQMNMQTFVRRGFPFEYGRGSAYSQSEHSRRGLSQQDIVSLPEYVFESKEKNSEALQCSICLGSFERDEMLRKLRCDHHYHKTCIDTWLEEKKTCPFCRTAVLPPLEDSDVGYDDSTFDDDESDHEEEIWDDNDLEPWTSEDGGPEQNEQRDLINFTL